MRTNVWAALRGSYYRSKCGTGVAAMGAVLLLALLGCEEMVEQDGGTRRSDSAVVRQLRSELAVPEGVQVIRVASPSPNLITYVLRNPGAQEPDTNTLRVASATDPTSSVGQRFDTPPRSVRNDQDDLRFVERVGFQEVNGEYEKAQEALYRAELFLDAYGELLAVGGLDVQAMRDWVERQKGITRIMHDWIADAWPGHITGIVFPTPTVETDLWHDPVLVEITGTVGAAISVTLPPATGGVPPLTYVAGARFETPYTTMGFGPGFRMPAGISFNAATRTLSGTPTESGRAIFFYGAYDVAVNEAWDYVVWHIVR